MEAPKTNWQPSLYNDKHNFVYTYGQSLVELLAPKSGERILDIGCGSGQLTATIAESGAEVFGIDNAASMIEDAQQRYPDITFGVKDASNFYFDQKFDALFSNAALHWVSDQAGAAQCMYENLRKGGRLVLEMGGFGNVKTITDALRHVLREAGYFKLADLQIWYFPSIGEYTSLLEQYGFLVKFAQHFDRPTLLESTSEGIKDWIRMFGTSFLKGISEEEERELLEEVQEQIRPVCFKDGRWYADYKRLRVVAQKV